MSGSIPTVFTQKTLQILEFGIKIRINAEAKTEYALNIQIYTGKEKGLGYCVVMDLMKPYYFKAYCLFVDNFYSSVKLFLDLLAKGTCCTSTAQTNRKYFPLECSKGVEPVSFCYWKM